jgi:hypothetical protein
MKTKPPRIIGKIKVRVSLPGPPPEKTVKRFSEKYHKKVVVKGMYGNREWQWPFRPHLFNTEAEIRKEGDNYIRATGNSISIFKQSDGKYVFFPHRGMNGPLCMVAKHFGAKYIDDIICLRM